MLERNPARAQRVLQLRKLTDLSQNGLSKLSGFPVNYIKQWEENEAEGLSESLALYFLRSLNKLGVDCSLKWLMEGSGEELCLKVVYDSSGGYNLIAPIC